MRDWLTHRARTSPDTTALVAAANGREWDYAALDTAVDQMAGRLAALGLEQGDHVGMLMEPRIDAVKLVHAAMRLGAVLVPLNTRLTADELAPQIERADLTTLVCGHENEPRAVEASEDVPVVSVDEPNWERVAELVTQPPESITPAEWQRGDIQTMLFTSGTTGSPKVVIHRMGNHLASAVASAFRLGVTPNDRWLVTLSLYHTGGLAPILRSTLYGTAVVLREGFEPGGAADDIDAYDVTVVSLVPTMLQEMLDARGTLSDSLRAVLLGGAPASADLIERCRDYSIPVYPTYGMTETASQIATATPDEAFEYLGTVGRPLLWTDLTIVGEDGDPVETGETGEFVVSGPTVTPGYYGDREATRAAFSEYGLRTGDIGYRDESGRLWVLNRRDDRIITGGENVDPGEVVSVLREHPDVDDAAVVGLPDAKWGERVAALVIPAGPDLTAETLEAHCREHLAGFKVPRTIEFTDELPRTTSGTVERPAVRNQLLEAVETEQVSAEAERAAGGTEGDREALAQNEAEDREDAEGDESERAKAENGMATAESETAGNEETAAEHAVEDGDDDEGEQPSADGDETEAIEAKSIAELAAEDAEGESESGESTGDVEAEADGTVEGESDGTSEEESDGSDEATPDGSDGAASDGSVEAESPEK